MKKISTTNNDEIDLISIIKIIWDGKIKILLITIISFLVGIGYNFQIPKNYLNSISINPSDDYQLKHIDNIKEIIKRNRLNRSDQINQRDKFNQSNLDKLYESNLDKFIAELKDYEEFLFNLKSTKKIKENISKVKIRDQEIELFRYAKLLTINAPKINKKTYTLHFKWHDLEEAKKILQNTLNLTSNNLKTQIYNELKQTLEFEKKLIFNENRNMLNYLEEQSAIAKELKIADQTIGGNYSQSNISFNINSEKIFYFLRGYKAIDKEIELIQNRDYKNLEFIEQEINKFKDLKINFVDYNVYLVETNSLKNTKLILMISILFGLIVGVFFVLISNAFSSQNASNKTR